MARGDQRERDQAKKQARLAKDGKGKAKDGRPEQRNANDSDALAAKVAMKAEMKKKQEEEEANAVSNAPVVRKKKKKEVDSLDDLFSAALTVKGRKK
mmetsp:Transcript_2101/g.3972  ORF Transcript_2101/g.3972 Transcript_2101/m.3972 type:complete len:97 (-) Transcript_2101:290-580(-)|eukprot:CAMPEP_0201870782 /NCGR_PEP_ID=MMETSP0902-20130614/3847_1 /ASSEMBLY_ACC=CAM_ASM_000551 /TAXON_ID=420261 /ORGANISM="Thalassiosira antarctica, Strain CCMP982" /LENGTH=96 /DNA_ID=CAMNT_0048396553 /DNA_START=103 /DNA_END=393 /DNA_ORIENTATION=-